MLGLNRRGHMGRIAGDGTVIFDVTFFAQLLPVPGATLNSIERKDSDEVATIQTFA
jgi:hypothetical protein